MYSIQLMQTIKIPLHFKNQINGRLNNRQNLVQYNSIKI